MNLFGEQYFFPYRISDEDRKKLIKEKLQYLTSLINVLCDNISGKVLFHNFKVPTFSPLGVLENKQKLGFFEMIRILKSKES